MLWELIDKLIFVTYEKKIWRFNVILGVDELKKNRKTISKKIMEKRENKWEERKRNKQQEQAAG